MDNDNKIIRINPSDDDSQESKEVMLFLEEELVPLKKRKRVTTYDLEKEYAKTKKNRAYSIWIIMSLTVAVVVLATWVTVKGMTVKTDELDVTLEAFEDLNLRNLFDALTKTQDLYEKAAKTKAELQAAYDARMSQATKSRDADLEYIRRLKLAKKNKDERDAAVHSRFRKTISEIHEEFDEKLQAAELELKQYEEQLKSFDSENVAKAQNWEKEMDSQRQVHEIEKTKLTEDYENQITSLKQQMTENQERSYRERRLAINDLASQYEARIAKLDPQVKDADVKSAIEKASEAAAQANFSPDAINQNVTITDEEYTEQLNALKEKYDSFVVLNNAAQSIPYSNGMSNVLNSQRQLANDMTNSIAAAGAGRISSLKAENVQLNAQVEKTTAEIARLKEAFSDTAPLLNNYAKAVKTDGFILTYTPGSDPVVFISYDGRSVVKNDGSTKATVTDSKGAKLATGGLWFKDSVYYLSLDEEVEEIPEGSYIKIKK